MKILYKKEINVPSGFYCNGCIYLGADKNINNRAVWCCKLSGLRKTPNSKGQLFKDNFCIKNCIETLENI